MKKIFTAIITCILLAVASHVFAQPGTLDSSFGVNGKVITFDSVVNCAIAIQPDGKTVMLGFFDQLFHTGEENYFVISRYNISGSLDSSFGINGRVDTRFGGGDFPWVIARSILIQPDGKIVVGGFKFGPAAPEYYILARYLPNGSLDSSFGENGKVIDDLGYTENELLALALQKDGKILVGGNKDGYCLMRYTSKGVRDSSFGANGMLRMQDRIDMESVSNILVMPDGKIITGDFFSDFEINRVLLNGSFDSSYGTNGAVFTDFYGGQDNLFSVVLLKDKSILAGGYSINDSTMATYMSLAKYTSSGQLDNSFGTNGKLSIVAPPRDNTTWSSNAKILLQPDGKTIFAGTLLTRFNANYDLDSTFGLNGKALNYDGTGNAVLQSDGKIVTINASSIQRFKGDPVTINIKKNISVKEGNSGMTPATFNIVLNEISSQRVKVDYKTIHGTAKADSDYIASSGTLIFQKGELSKTVTVNVIGDSVAENNEQFYLQLANAKNAVLGTAIATCTIKDDDPLSPESSTNQNALINNTNIRLYPNPVKDELHIEGLTTIKATLSVIDIWGRELFKTIINNESNAINVKKLSAGVYYLRIETEQKITILKFIKG